MLFISKWIIRVNWSQFKMYNEKACSLSTLLFERETFDITISKWNNCFFFLTDCCRIKKKKNHAVRQLLQFEDHKCCILVTLICQASFKNHGPSLSIKDTLPCLYLKELNNQRLQLSVLRLLPSVAVGSQGLVIHETDKISALCLKLFEAVINPKENVYIIISGLFFLLEGQSLYFI